MADMLPRLFFSHFSATSIMAEKDEELIGFLIGFYSQTEPNKAYIHFVGVSPNWRKQQIGKKMYDQFFKVAQSDGITSVHCITSPMNKTSIAYHTKMGFELVPGDRDIEGVPVHTNYDGPDKDRVLFCRRLGDKESV